MVYLKKEIRFGLDLDYQAFYFDIYVDLVMGIKPRTWPLSPKGYLFFLLMEIKDLLIEITFWLIRVIFLFIEIINWSTEIILVLIGITFRFIGVIKGLPKNKLLLIRHISIDLNHFSIVLNHISIDLNYFSTVLNHISIDLNHASIDLSYILIDLNQILIDLKPRSATKIAKDHKFIFERM